MQGCGGSCFPVLSRTLNKAERVGDAIYLYETAYMSSCNGIYCVNGDVIREWGDWIGNEAPGGYLDFDFDNYPFEQFKWIFEKSEEGDYVFRGIERVEDGI